MRELSIHFAEVAAARGGLCNLHLHDALMVKIAGMFPNATFITHASTYAAENLAAFDNVWFEVVQYPDGRDSVWDFNWFANKVGRERLIFGADLPYYEYRVLQQKIEAADIDEDLKDRIAYKNILPLIQQFNPTWQMPDAPPKTPRIYGAEELWAVNPEQTDRLVVYG